MQPQDWVSTSNSASSLGWLLAIPPRRAFRNPKSSTFTYPSGRSMMCLSGFDVAMNNSRLVSGGERTGHLDWRLSTASLTAAVRALDVAEGGLAFRSVHWDVRIELILADLVNRQNIG